MTDPCKNCKKSRCPTVCYPQRDYAKHHGRTRFARKHDHINKTRWIARNNVSYSPFDPDTEEWVYVCSACGEEQPHKSDYCPHCGAKMDEEGDDG